MHLEDHRNSRSATDHGITGQQHVQQVSTRRVRQIWDVAIQHHIIRNLTLECIPRQVVMGKIRTMLEHVSSDGRIDSLQILVEIRPGLRDLLLFFGQTVIALEKECVGALQIGDHQISAFISSSSTPLVSGSFLAMNQYPRTAITAYRAKVQSGRGYHAAAGRWWRRGSCRSSWRRWPAPPQRRGCGSGRSRR